MKHYDSRAKEALQNTSSDSGRLIRIYAGILAAVSLAVFFLNYVLSQQIGNTGGLAGMGTRAALNTVRSIVSMLVSLLRPFWSVGILYAALGILRGEHVQPPALMQGFRCAGHVFFAQFLRYLRCSGIMILASMVCAEVLFNMTPSGQEITALLMPYVQAGMTTVDEATMELIYDKSLYLTMASAAAGALAAFVFSYRYRLAMFRVLDVPQEGARMALNISRLSLRNGKKDLFLLDLHFWWYYLALFALAALPNADLLLAFTNVTLPVRMEILMIILNIISIAGVFCVRLAAQNRVTVAYAAFYEERTRQGEES